MHLIDKHMYPKNYFFAVTRDGIDGRRSLLLEGSRRRRRSSAAASTTISSTATAEGAAKAPQEPAVDKTPKISAPGSANKGVPTTKEPVDVEMDDLTGAMSALRFVPPSVRFGRGGRKAGFAKR